ncbi:hypothetical protein [Mycobacterium sp.]|uniref:hypothetical protein n=1 Tax=Mycobacterium sp. TaxID=1785 RepID=UPI002B6ECA89|nr:hypothetical protein [Mycobacterium sp.]HKP39618.1 hypothetical protein [Mycobacterium sp.]
MPDAFARGKSRVGPDHSEPWAEVPRSALDGVVHFRVSGKLAWHSVSLRHRLLDGRIVVEFVGPPAVSRAIGLIGVNTWVGRLGRT